MVQVDPWGLSASDGKGGNGKGKKIILQENFIKSLSYIPVEGIGINTSSVFSASIIQDSKSLSIFVSGWYVGQNLVDEYILIGYASVSVNGNNIETKPLQYPKDPFIAQGYPYRTIGEAKFNYQFDTKDNVQLELKLGLGIAVDFGVNKAMYWYNKERINSK